MLLQIYYNKHMPKTVKAWGYNFKQLEGRVAL